jgi:hypothetical protein
MIFKRIGVSLVASALLGAFALGAGPALATHEHPGTANSLHADLVPLSRATLSTTQCAARGGTVSSHGAPLSFTSCNPPTPQPGTVARTGVDGRSALDATVLPGDADPTNGDQAELSIVATALDLRSGSSGGPDYDPVATAGAQDMTAIIKFRISDHENSTVGQPCDATTTCPATMIDYDFLVPLSCAATSNPGVGSTCGANTTGDAITPGMIKENRQNVVQLSRVRFRDAGSDGIPGNSNDRDAFLQGVYIP